MLELIVVLLGCMFKYSDDQCLYTSMHSASSENKDTWCKSTEKVHELCVFQLIHLSIQARGGGGGRANQRI